MNILFISFDADPPYMGGLATVVNVLAKDLLNKGHKVALGYYHDYDHPSVFFKNKIKFEKENYSGLHQFLIAFQADIIYNALPIITDYSFFKTLPLGKCKIISAYHNKPLLRYYPFQSLMNLYYNSDNILYKFYTLAKIPLLPIWKYYSQKKELRQFKIMINESDKVQILSEKFIPALEKIIPNVNRDKLIAIENPIVFSNKYFNGELVDKLKKVLVVCNTNYQKRTRLMIKIWAELEKDERFSDWSFDFVGEGEEFIRIFKLSKKLKLKRINFLGSQNPERFYKQSSVFMMTSRFEGWPMVLMEAMQMGVVPVVFNSFESLSDIIRDNFNGFIIPNNNRKLFVDKMKYLMLHRQERIRLAENGLRSCNKFTIDKISDKFIHQFQKLVREN